jgi:phosphatidylethanolamine/phosphatidyl-N-methylethanolamine N-methyltransferase
MTLEGVERIYTSYSDVYDLFFDTILAPGRRRAIEAMGLRPGHRVLEVGVGTGLSLPMYPAGCRVTGIDISEAMLDRARGRIAGLPDGTRRGFELRRMSAESLEADDGAFDRVLLSYVISCVEHPDEVVREVHRVCAPGGRVLFLNHFASRTRPIAWAEKRLSRLTRRLGFVLDLPREVITRTGLFDIERIERVNYPGFWTLAVCVPRPR